MNRTSLFTPLSMWFCCVSIFLLVFTSTVFTESLTIQSEPSPAGLQTVSADATLSDLLLTDVSLQPSFSPEETTYTAESSVSETTVSVSTTHSAASIVMPDDIDLETDGVQVALGEGETIIRIVVTAEDGITEQTYTVTVSRRETDVAVDADTERVVLPDEQGSDTQAFTGKLTLTLDPNTDSGTTGDGVTDYENTQSRFIRFIITAPSNFPVDSNDHVAVFKAVSDALILRPSFSCADSTAPTAGIYSGSATAGGHIWSQFVTIPAPDNANSKNAYNQYIRFDNGPHCFIAVYKPNGANDTSTLSTHSDLFEITVDTVRPTVTVVEQTTDSVYAYANETTTSKTKDNIAAENCTDSTSTASGWSDYTLDGTAVTFSGSGRCFIFTDVAGNKRAAHTSAKVSGVAIVDYDSDDNNLIEIDGNNEEALAKLNAMRYDLDGNGIPDSPASAAAYRVAFPGTVPAGILFGCPSTCTGYELKRSLDFDTDGDGKTATGTVGYPTGDSDDAYYNGGIGWEPVGARTNRFQATFDGNGYTIDNLFVRRFRPAQTDVDAALFGAVGTGGIVRNLGLRYILVRSHGDVGGIAAQNYGTIQTSFVTGDLFGYKSGLFTANNYGTIAHSYGKGTVGAHGGGADGGGIAGNLLGSGTIKKSWVAATVAHSGGNSIGGGIVGNSQQGTSITNSYFDQDVYGSSADPNRRTTGQLQSPTGYTGIYATWDDDNIDGVTGADAPWDFSTDNQYPLLTIGGHQLDRQVPMVTTIIATPDDGQVTLTWTARGTIGVSGWQFTYKTQDAADWESWAAVPSSTASTTSHVVSSLTNGTVYHFKVRAIGGFDSTEVVAVPNTGIPATDFDADDNNLIEITTLAQLNAVRYDLDADSASSGTVADKKVYHDAFITSRVGFFCDACVGYELKGNLNLDTDNSGETWTGTTANPSGDSADTYYNGGKGWIPLGDYTAIFDGNGYIIDNLFVKRESGDAGDAGLFKTIGRKGIVRNLGIRNILIRTHSNAGGIAGENSGVIQTSFVTGSSFGNTSGLIVANNSGTIAYSYTKGDAGIGVTGSIAGGIAGNRETSGGTIKNSWTATNVNRLGGTHSGIATAGTITNSYFDKTVYGTTTDTNGKTTSELQSPTGYTGIYATWDDEDIDGVTGADAPWDFMNEDEYPLLTFGGHVLQNQRSGTLESGPLIATPDDGEVTITWGPDSIAGVTGWQFTHKTQDDGSWGIWADVPSSTERTTTYTVPSLTNGTTYHFKVRAKGGGADRGEESAIAVATPNTSIPATDFDANDNNLIDITTLAQLNAVRYDLDGNGVPDGSAADKVSYLNVFKTSRTGFFCDTPCIGYELLNSLDLDTDDDGKTWTGTKASPTGDSGDTYDNSGKGWIPLGDYTATFDGNGYTIDNLFVNRGAGDDGAAGLFKTISATGIVRNLGLRNVLVRTHNTTGGNAGGIAGTNSGTIETSFVTGTNFGHNSGLLVADNPGTVAHSYTTGEVNASGASSVAGGIAGNSGASDGTIKNSWSATTVTQTGSGGSKNGIATAGTITNSYFDKTVYGTTTDTNGKTTTELQSPTGYTGIYATWDDEDIDGVTGADAPWNFGTTSQYPLLTFGGHQTQRQVSTATSFLATPGNTQATLTWVGSPETTSISNGWEFDYKTQLGNWTGWADVPSSTASTTSHVVPSLTNGTLYIFRVRAKGKSGIRGPSSAEAVATPSTATPMTNFDSDGDNLIEITTLAQLNAMRYDLDGDGVPSGTISNKLAYHTVFNTSRTGFLCEACAGYELMKDLDFDTDGDGITWAGTVDSPTGDSGDAFYSSGSGWLPIDGFATTFNGNGFVISNLFVNRTTKTDAGLFGYILSPSVLSNVALHNVLVKGNQEVAALVGENFGAIYTSYATGDVTSVGAYVGGLVAHNHGTVSSSYSTVDVKLGGVGGAGGLVGVSETNSATIKNSYSIGTITGSGFWKGGLQGSKLTGSTVTNSYWDTEASGHASAGNGNSGTGKTTAQLKTPVDYTGIYSTWDEDDVDGDGEDDAPWDFGTTSTYPLLTFGGHLLKTQLPQDLAVINLAATPDDGEVTLTWDSTSIVGITGWEFDYKTQGGGSWVGWAAVPSVTWRAPTHTIESLTNGTAYVFRVRAKGAGSTTGDAVETWAVTPGTSIPALDFDSNDNNLIEITTLAQLDAVRYDLDGDSVPSGTTADRGAYYAAFRTSLAGSFCDACAGYELMNDLDFDTDGSGATWTGTESNPTGDSADAYNNSGKGWIPLGDYAATFDGNRYTIDNLFVNRGASDNGNAGLFKTITATGIVRNLELTNVLTRSQNVTYGNAGGIASVNSGTIQTSSVEGDSLAHTAGLLVSDNLGTIAHSYTKGTVSVSGDSSIAGGIAGGGATGTIKNSWTATIVTQTGSGGSKNGIATAGTITNSYFDKTVYGTTTDTNGKTTTELQSPTGYTGIYATWDDDDLDGDGEADAPWAFGADSEYPVLNYGSNFTLDLDASGTFVPRQDLLGTYLYTAEGISSTQLREYTHNQEIGVANAMVELIGESITGVAPPLDFDGNGTVTPRQDILGAYLYTAEGISRIQLREYTHNQEIGVANGMADTIDALIE